MQDTVSIFTAGVPEERPLPSVAGCALGLIPPEPAEGSVPASLALSYDRLDTVTRITADPYPLGDGGRTLRRFAENLAQDGGGVVVYPDGSVRAFADPIPFPRLSEFSGRLGMYVYFRAGKHDPEKRSAFLRLADEILPFAIPERFGDSVPPRTETASAGRAALEAFLGDCARPVCYPAFPVTHLFFREDAEPGKCGFLALHLAGYLWDYPSWRKALIRLMTETAILFGAFFGQIAPLPCPVVAAEWKGIPAQTGKACVFGPPYAELIGNGGVTENGYTVFSDPDKPDVPGRLVSLPGASRRFRFGQKAVFAPAEYVPPECGVRSGKTV